MMESAPQIALNSKPTCGASSQSPYQKVKHPIYPLAIIRPKRELAKIAFHVLPADLNMG